ncbi:MAG: hypothetical protein ACRCW4_14165 [Candidatus Neomicrothrix subdominans]
MAVDCDPPIPPAPPSDPNACPFPPLPETEPITIVDGLCTTDGRPVWLAYAPGRPNNAACPPTPGAPAIPGYLGWIDPTVDATVVNTTPEPVLVQCGEKLDFELNGIWCVIDDATGLSAGNVVWELQRDEISGAIITGQWLSVPDGAPFTVPAGHHVDRCPTPLAPDWEQVCVTNDAGVTVITALQRITLDGLGQNVATFHDATTLAPLPAGYSVIDCTISRDWERVCATNDAGATIIPAYRRFVFVGTAQISSLLDVSGAPLAASYLETECLAPHRFKDHEAVCVSDDGGITITPAFVKIETDHLGVETWTIVDELGVAVDPTFLLVPCQKPAEFRDWERVCVTNDGGLTRLPAYRHWHRDAAGVITSTLVDPDGVAVAAGFIEIDCQTPDLKPLQVNDCTPAGCVEFLRWTDGVHPHVDTTLDGLTIYVPVGPVSHGPCVTSPPTRSIVCEVFPLPPVPNPSLSPATPGILRASTTAERAQLGFPAAANNINGAGSMVAGVWNEPIGVGAGSRHATIISEIPALPLPAPCWSLTSADATITWTKTVTVAPTTGTDAYPGFIGATGPWTAQPPNIPGPTPVNTTVSGTFTRTVPAGSKFAFAMQTGENNGSRSSWTVAVSWTLRYSTSACPSGNEQRTLVRVTIVACDGTITSAYEYNGAAYTPTGTLTEGPCAPTQQFRDWERTCATADGGLTKTIAYRAWHRDDAGATAATLVDSSGSPLGAGWVEVECAPAQVLLRTVCVTVTRDGGTPGPELLDQAYTIDSAGTITVIGWREYITGADVPASDAATIVPAAPTECACCIEASDFEEVCVSDDGGITVLPAVRRIDTDSAGVSTSVLLDRDTLIPIAGFSVVACTSPVEFFDWEKVCATEDGIAVVNAYKVWHRDPFGVVTSQIVDETGVPLAATFTQTECPAAPVDHFDWAPVCITEDGGVTVVRAWKVWRRNSFGVYSMEYIDDAGTALISATAWVEVPCIPKELDQISLDGALYCVEEPAATFTPWYRREVQVIDNSTGLSIASTPEWSTDGAVWSATTPTGVIRAGACMPSSVQLRQVCVTITRGGVAPGPELLDQAYAVDSAGTITVLGWRELGTATPVLASEAATITIASPAECECCDCDAAEVTLLDFEEVCVSEDGGVTVVRAVRKIATTGTASVSTLHDRDTLTALPAAFLVVDCVTPAEHFDWEPVCITEDGGTTIVRAWKVWRRSAGVYGAEYLDDAGTVLVSGVGWVETSCPGTAWSALDTLRATFAPNSLVAVGSTTIPVNARGVTLYNDTAAVISLNTTHGSHIIPPRATHSVTFSESSAPFGGSWSVVTIQGTSGATLNGINPSVIVNWVTRTP